MGKAKLCYMDTDNNRRHLLRQCKYIKTRFDTSNYELDRPRPLPKGENKKVIG